jgi:hypothetical protein
MQNRTGRGLLLIVALLTLTLTLAFAPAASARGGTNLVRNPGFEIDANLDSRPDDWTPSTPAFTRSAAVVKSGSYSGKYYLSAIGQSRVGQRINGITPGRMYVFNTGLNMRHHARALPSISSSNGRTPRARPSRRASSVAGVRRSRGSTSEGRFGRQRARRASNSSSICVSCRRGTSRYTSTTCRSPRVSQAAPISESDRPCSHLNRHRAESSRA